MDKKALDKQLKSDVKPGTESIAINEAQSSANQIVAERSNNLAQERAIATSSATHDSELRAALELGASNGPANVVQPRMMNNRVAQSPQLRPETQEVLSKYGINPSLRETNRSSSNSKVTRVTGSTTNVQQGNQQSQQPIRVTNTTNNNVTNVTNNTTTINTKVDSGKMVAPQAPVVPQITTVAPQANDGKFKAFLNNLFSKRELEKKAQEREWRKRDFELKKYAERVTRRMQDIGNQFAKRMDPALMGQSTGKQIKGILALAGLTILPAYLPKVIELLEKGKDLISGGFGKLSEIFSSDGTFLNKVGDTISVGWTKVSQSIAEVMGGKNGETIGDVIGEKIVQFLGGDPEKGDTLLNTLETVGNNIAERISEKMELIFKERSDAVKAVLDAQDWGFDWKKNLTNLGQLIAAGFGGWNAARRIAEERMATESADYYRGGLFSLSHQRQNITEATDEKGNLPASLKSLPKGMDKNKISKGMTGYMSEVGSLSSDSNDNNADKIVFGLNKVVEADTRYSKEKTVVKYKNGEVKEYQLMYGAGLSGSGDLPSIKKSDLDNLVSAYSVLDEEKEKISDNLYKVLDEYVKNGSVIHKDDGSDLYQFKRPGQLSEIIKLASGNKYDPSKGLVYNQDALQIIRAARIGDTTFDWGKVTRQLIGALVPLGLIKTGHPFFGIAAAYDWVTDVYKDLSDPNRSYYRSTLSPEQTLLQEARNGIEQYQADMEAYSKKYTGKQFFKLYEGQQGKTAELANQAHRNYVERINEYADYVPGLGPNTFDLPEKSESSGSSGSSQGSGSEGSSGQQQTKKETPPPPPPPKPKTEETKKKSVTGSSFGDVTKSTPESHPDEPKKEKKSSTGFVFRDLLMSTPDSHPNNYVEQRPEAKTDINPNQGGGKGTITGPITDEERARRIPGQAGLKGAWDDGWTDSDSDASAKYVINWLRDKGLSTAQAAGIVGVMLVESGCNPKAVNENGVKGSGYYRADKGICQWQGDRSLDFSNWYKKTFNYKTDDPSVHVFANETSMDTQLEYMWQDMKGPQREAFWETVKETGPGSGLSDAEVVQKMADAMYMDYENGGGKYHNTPENINKKYKGINKSDDPYTAMLYPRRRRAASIYEKFTGNKIGDIDKSKLLGGIGSSLGSFNPDWNKGNGSNKSSESEAEGGSSSSSTFSDIFNSIVGKIGDTGKYLYDTLIDFLNGDDGGKTEEAAKPKLDKSPLIDQNGNPVEGTDGYKDYAAKVSKAQGEIRSKYDEIRSKKEQELADAKVKLDYLNSITDYQILRGEGVYNNHLKEIESTSNRIKELESELGIDGSLNKSMLAELEKIEENKKLGVYASLLSQLAGVDEEDPEGLLSTLGIPDEYFMTPTVDSIDTEEALNHGLQATPFSGIKVSSSMPTLADLRFTKPDTEEVKEAEETALPTNNILNTNNGNSVNNFNTVVNNDNRSIEEIRGRSSLTETSLRH